MSKTPYLPVKAVLAPPSGNFMGNLCWPGELPPAATLLLPSSLESIRARGYFASAFPRGDGMSIAASGEGEPFDAARAAIDFAECFPFLEILLSSPGVSLAAQLAQIAKDRTMRCRYLLPVEGLRVDERLSLGDTILHPPVDGCDHLLADHAWSALCDVPGADIDPNWAPGPKASATTELLGHPLIERVAVIPLSLLYEAKASFAGSQRLLRFLLEDSDTALDPIRFSLCHYRRLEYLPAKPGWVGDMALAYIVPESASVPEQLVTGKPYVLRVSNNWLGLQLDSSAIAGRPTMLAGLLDSDAPDEITLALKSALRALNKAFYLVDLEASFLHMVYATDALCDPQALKGERQRIWIVAVASGGRADRFAALLAKYAAHYDVRNKIVHEGATFASLGVDGEDQCQFMLELLGCCITSCLAQGFVTRRDMAQFTFNLLGDPGVEAEIAAMAPSQFTLPVAGDKVFKKHMAP